MNKLNNQYIKDVNKLIALYRNSEVELVTFDSKDIFYPYSYNTEFLELLYLMSLIDPTNEDLSANSIVDSFSGMNLLEIQQYLSYLFRAERTQCGCINSGLIEKKLHKLLIRTKKRVKNNG